MSDFQPRPGSLAYMVAAFFKQAPDEELRGPDIAAKWPTSSPTRSAALGALEDADFITSRREGNTNIYTAGPRLAAWQPEPGTTASAWTRLDTTTAAAEPNARQPRQMPPPEALVIEPGVPVPRNLRDGTGGRYDAIFSRMQPGDSFATPKAQAKPMYDTATRWAKRAGIKAKFALRHIDPNTSRIWRTE